MELTQEEVNERVRIKTEAILNRLGAAEENIGDLNRYSKFFSDWINDFEEQNISEKEFILNKIKELENKTFNEFDLILNNCVTGPAGPKGDTGATGPAGPKGDTEAIDRINNKVSELNSNMTYIDQILETRMNELEEKVKKINLVTSNAVDKSTNAYNLVLDLSDSISPVLNKITHQPTFTEKDFLWVREAEAKESDNNKIIKELKEKNEKLEHQVVNLQCCVNNLTNVLNKLNTCTKAFY